MKDSLQTWEIKYGKDMIYKATTNINLPARYETDKHGILKFYDFVAKKDVAFNGSKIICII